MKVAYTRPFSAVGLNKKDDVKCEVSPPRSCRFLSWFMSYISTWPHAAFWVHLN